MHFAAICVCHISFAYVLVAKSKIQSSFRFVHQKFVETIYFIYRFLFWTDRKFWPNIDSIFKLDSGNFARKYLLAVETLTLNTFAFVLCVVCSVFDGCVRSTSSTTFLTLHLAFGQNRFRFHHLLLLIVKMVNKQKFMCTVWTLNMASGPTVSPAQHRTTH